MYHINNQTNERTWHNCILRNTELKSAFIGISKLVSIISVLIKLLKFKVLSCVASSSSSSSNVNTWHALKSSRTGHPASSNKKSLRWLKYMWLKWRVLSEGNPNPTEEKEKPLKANQLMFKTTRVLQVNMVLGNLGVRVLRCWTSTNRALRKLRWRLRYLTLRLPRR